MPPILFTNAHIYAPDSAHTWHTAMLVEQERIRWVGHPDDLGPQVQATPHSLEGGYVLPGLTDAHTHFLALALLTQRVNLRGTRSLAEALQRIAEYARTTSAMWIEGHGWNEHEWVEHRLPTRHDLDAILPARPVALSRIDGHLLWCNSLALQMAGITADTPDPEGGQIDRDEHGEPTGILRETARLLVSRIIPEPPLATKVAALEAAQRDALALGLTGVHTIESALALEAYQTLEQENRLRMRILFMPMYDALNALRTTGKHPGSGSARLRLGQLKLFSDGTLGSRTAWLLAPYSDAPDELGLPTYTPDELHALVAEAHRAGWPVAIHAIGDAANRAALDAIEAAPPHNSTLPDRIEHVQLIHPDDVPRFAQLGVIASMQPIHMASDWRLAEQRWGERARFGYAWRTLRAAGAVLAFGSDAPIEPINPWPNLQVAVTRRDLDGNPPEGWYPLERLALADALDGFTHGAAVAAGLPHEGRLSVGAFADFIVLEHNPFTTPPENLATVRPLRTFVGGEEVNT
ncbi:amidohydrolase [Ardenticatena maritima]|uniref:Amidohydrolase 3 domain-containing protein n=1 Tax=Ardenticatena maritima TaxID=872965 RepID=A0A0N8GS67_9CHLR|nr:amidohydrolase [Ardenticatena maritima]KPL88450.1 hypothetical protein SE16_06535 [Ardenticatena maritima]